MSMSRKGVWFNRVSAVLWAVFGLAALPLGWANSVVLVWLASAYANAKTDWGTAAAQDDSSVLDAIQELREEVRANGCHCSQSLHRE
jgi:hypothetical protein